jgi:hypothetical protein
MNQLIVEPLGVEVNTSRYLYALFPTKRLEALFTFFA